MKSEKNWNTADIHCQIRKNQRHSSPISGKNEQKSKLKRENSIDKRVTDINRFRIILSQVNAQIVTLKVVETLTGPEPWRGQALLCIVTRPFGFLSSNSTPSCCGDAKRTMETLERRRTTCKAKFARSKRQAHDTPIKWRTKRIRKRRSTRGQGRKFQYRN